MERARREARQAEKRSGEMEKEKEAGAGRGKSKGAKGKGAKGKGGGMDDLAGLIQQRQKRAGDFVADLEAKYAPKKGKKRSLLEDKLPEEAFQRNAVKGKAATATVDTKEEPAGRSQRSKRVKK